jgi:hypothetical protein
MPGRDWLCAGRTCDADANASIWIWLVEGFMQVAKFGVPPPSATPGTLNSNSHSKFCQRCRYHRMRPLPLFGGGQLLQENVETGKTPSVHDNAQQRPGKHSTNSSRTCHDAVLFINALHINI